MVWENARVNGGENGGVRRSVNGGFGRQKKKAAMDFHIFTAYFHEANQPAPVLS